MDTDVVARRRSVLAFVVADAVALMVFVVAGIRSHHEVGALDLFLRNAVPLELAWFAVSMSRRPTAGRGSERCYGRGSSPFRRA